MPNGISIEQSNGLLEVTLDRPDRLNSFVDEMHIELRRVLEQAAVDPDCRAILLTGRGRGFCAGQDLQARDPRADSSPPNLQRTLSSFFNPTVSLIRRIENRLSVPSMALPLVPVPIWLWPVTSCLPPAAHASSNHSPKSV